MHPWDGVRFIGLLKGTSKNSNFFVRARKHRPESRSLRGVNEDSRMELTLLSLKKCIFRGALNEVFSSSYGVVLNRRPKL